jgi:hypothetical protein
LYSLVAALSARFSLRSDSQLMWVRVVTGSDIRPMRANGLNLGVRAQLSVEFAGTFLRLGI